ncbi:MAG: chitobiase/beta-hexosaminidase C-terminal domain-containing protein, partial [Spirochaetia bacterium]|nr:chitobiase/beta-hexosaminidase C-terminal domain-containing protein [Spirochaetia bacterium]
MSETERSGVMMKRTMNTIGAATLALVAVLALAGCPVIEEEGYPGWPTIEPQYASTAIEWLEVSITVDGGDPGQTVSYGLLAPGATGGTPSSWIRYEGPFVLDRSATVVGRTELDGTSYENEKAFTIIARTPTAVLSGGPEQAATTGSYSFPFDVLFALDADADPRNEIWYTLDGSDPVPGAPSLKWEGAPITIDGAGPVDLKAVAWREGVEVSPSFYAKYTRQTELIAPTFYHADLVTLYPPSGTYDTPQTVRMGGPYGSTLYWTLDGSDPTDPASARGWAEAYLNPAINVGRPMTVRAYAIRSGYADSPVATVQFDLRAGTPTFSVAGGTYTDAQTVTISTTTP